jgi:hypothetical protein
VRIEERRVSNFRNDTNVVTVVSPEWAAWLRLGRVQNFAKHGHRTFKVGQATTGRGAVVGGVGI